MASYRSNFTREMIGMAHSKQIQEKFIELRGQGLSFEKISGLIEVSKPTLMKWQNDMRTEISTAEALEYQTLLEMHKLSKRHKIECHSILLSKVMAEIGSRDLSNESIKDLLLLKSNCETSIAKNLNETVFAWQTSFDERMAEDFQDNRVLSVE